MSKSHLELKVGLFALIGLTLIGVLLLMFSKGLTLFSGTYVIQLHSRNVSGLKPRAYVFVSGVQVGTVSDIKLEAAGKSVSIYLKIYDRYAIYPDARFVIETAGFLGDQYVSIIPGANKGEPLTNNATAYCEQPLNIQEVARSAAGFLRRVDETAGKLNDAVSDLRRLLLNDHTLTNLAQAVDSLHLASTRAVVTLDEFNAMIKTNAPAVAVSFSNLVVTSEGLNQFSMSLNGLMAANTNSISASVSNIESSTLALKNLLQEAEAGKGLAGTLLHNEEVAANVADIVANLSITTSNLNRLGLWGILWSKKPARTNEPTTPVLTSPRHPFN